MAGKEKTPDEIKAQEEADRAASQAKGAADAEANRLKLEARLANLEQQAAESQQRADESAREVALLRGQLGKPGDGAKATVKMVSHALDADKAHDRLRSIWPLSAKRMPPPEPMTAKTFKVTPVGKLAAGMAPAIVENCADEGDAKAAFFKGREEKAYKVAVKVEPWGATRQALERAREERQAEWDRKAKEHAKRSERQTA